MSDKNSGILKVVGAVALIPLGLFLWTYVQVRLWDWFVVPYLHLPHLTFWVMYGLNLFISTFKAPVKESPTDWSSVFSHAVLTPLVLLGIGKLIVMWCL